MRLASWWLLMLVLHGLDSARFEAVVLTIGNFDGVHLGHQAILAAGRRRADAARTRLVAMTFDPHPLAVLTPEHVPAMLTPLEEKLHQLERAGADVAVVVRSSVDLLKISAADFIAEVIVARFRPRAVVEGISFGFGRHREGNVESLQAATGRYGFEVEVVGPVRIALGGHPDTVISSSLVRQLLVSGTVDRAAICLGRPYALLGPVIHGVGRGVTLGFPTANIDPGRQLAPAQGVYAGRSIVDGKPYPAAISIGRNPTFGGHELAVEAYLLDFAGDLYGRSIRIEFLDWLRPQVKYESAEALHDQIARDVELTRKIFGASS
jgi:riboflavin kinase/FMN adenylyltransferase